MSDCDIIKLVNLFLTMPKDDVWYDIVRTRVSLIPLEDLIRIYGVKTIP